MTNWPPTTRLGSISNVYPPNIMAQTPYARPGIIQHNSNAPTTSMGQMAQQVSAQPPQPAQSGMAGPTQTSLALLGAPNGFEHIGFGDVAPKVTPTWLKIVAAGVLVAGLATWGLITISKSLRDRDDRAY